MYQAANLDQPDRLVDFSVNVNPFGAPAILKERWLDWYQLVEDYPDPYATELRRELSKIEGIEEKYLLIGNGGAELISLVAQLLNGQNVLIIEPAFSEYEQACLAQKCHVDHHILLEGNWSLNTNELLPKIKKYGAIFLCTPNNPTGVVYDRNSIIQLLEEGKRNNCFIIIDEAFFDFSTEHHSYLSFIKEYPNLIILRSLTKMYAIAGLRLGYMAAHSTIIEKLSALKPHWSVNAIAMKAGLECLFQESFVIQTRQHIDKERQRLEAFYKKTGFRVSHSKVNFYLLQDPAFSNATPLFHFLLEKGFVPRHTMNFPGLDGRWLRFAIKRTEHNQLLMEALSEWKNRK